MNSLYIGIGVAIILALVTALIGPIFVDWGTHRAVFEAEASRIVGLPVRVLGDVDARLLPSPRVRFGDVVIGDLARPVARVGRFELDLDVAGLIRGETRVSDLVLDRPSIDLTLEADGRLSGLPHQGADLGDVRIETVRFVDGRVRLVDRRSSADWSATRLAGSGSVESLAGAWRLEAHGQTQGQALDLRLAARGSGAARVLRSVVGLPDAGLTLSGDLGLGDRGPADAGVVEAGAGEPGGRPRLSGPITIERRGEGASTITATAALTLDGDAGRLDDLALVVGDAVDGLRFEGSVRADFGKTASLDVDLAAKRIDLDGRSVVPGGARARLLALAEPLRGLSDHLPLPRATRFAVGLGTVAVAGGLVGDVVLEGRTRGGGFTVDRLSARLPGDARLDLSGRLGLGDGVVLDGRGTLAVGTPETLAAWWTGEAAGEARIGDLSLDGGFTLSRDGFFGPDLAVTLAGARARGRVEKRADGALRLGLSADRLDGVKAVSLMRRLGGGAVAGGAFDLDLDVRELVLGVATAKGARVALRLSDDAVAIDRLAIADLAGARLSGSGRIASAWTAPTGTLDLAFAAERPATAVAALAELTAPATPEAVRAAAMIGAAAGPLDLTMRLTGGTATGGDALRLTLSGRAAGGDLALDGTWTGRLDDLAHGRIDARADLAGARLSPAAAGMLGVRPGEASILTGTIAGRASEGIGFSLEAGLGGRRATIAGTLTRPDAGPPKADVRASLAAPDIGLLAGLAGRPGLAFERSLPVDVKVAATGWGDRWAVSDLSGTIAETMVTASGELDLAGPRPKVGGRVRLDRADAAVLADTALAAGVDVDVGLTVDRLDLDEDGFATAVTGRVSAEPGAARVVDLVATVAGASVGGAVRARVVGAETAVSGRLTAQAVGLDTARSAGRPRLSGRLSGEVVFEAQGADRAGLVASASGSGRIRLDQGRIAGVGLDGLKAPAGDGEGSADQVVRAMAKAETMLPPLDLPVLLDKGVIQVPRFQSPVADGRLSGRATIDPIRGTVDGVLTVEPDGTAAVRRASAVSHAVPSLDLVLSGPIAAPVLSADTAGLTAFLSLHRLEREIEAAEALRQDRVERLRFATILKRIEERRRAREAAARAAMPPVGDTPTPPPGDGAPVPAPGGGDAGAPPMR